MYKIFCLIFVCLGVLLLPVTYAENIESNPLMKDMVLIPSGKFKMGCNNFGPLHGAPEHLVYLSSYMIDKYEVTNKLYEEIIPDHKTRRSILSNCDDCPVTNVSWYGAADYCYLIGKTLPSEAQWEKAAGTNDGCSFPWGYDSDSLENHARGGLKLRDKSNPVGSFPPNKNGVYDLAGNVWEWVSDWMAPGYQLKELRLNPKGPNTGVMKVRRGGSYSDDIIAMATGYRDWSYPSSRYFSDIGFRCAINILR
jgi:iron(II)-dependent oxidoreductase